MDFFFKENEDVSKAKRNIFLRKIQRLVNRAISMVTPRLELNVVPDGTSQMITLEQCMNIYHLVDQVLFFKVPGELVELGCHTGESAIPIQAVNRKYGYPSKLHVFDRFNLVDDTVAEIKLKLLRNFQKQELLPPVIHEGFFSDTIPSQLPDQIAFIHIDIGCGTEQDELRKTFEWILEQIYPRMAPGAICLIADYHDPNKTLKGTNSNPGVKLACDHFFSKVHGEMNVLFGNHYSHGFFRKTVPQEQKSKISKASGNSSFSQRSQETY